MKKNNNWIFFVIVIIIIAAAVFLFFQLRKGNDPAYSNGTNKAIYNYYVFNKLDDNKWYLDLSIRNKPYVIPFYYTPFQTEDVPVDNQTIKTMASYLNKHRGGRVYITLDPNETSKIVVAGVEIARLLGTKYDIFNFDVRTAVTYAPYENFTQYPIVTCANAKPNIMVILINITGANGIISENNCIQLNAADLNETVRVADAFSYLILGIQR